MNLQEAIAIKTRTGDALLNIPIQQIEQANGLLLEAANFIILCRVAEPSRVPELLPGETID